MVFRIHYFRGAGLRSIEDWLAGRSVVCCRVKKRSFGLKVYKDRVVERLKGCAMWTTRRHSIQQGAKGLFTGNKAPVLKTKVQNVTTPPPLKKSVHAAQKKDAAIFLSCWDLSEQGGEDCDKHQSVIETLEPKLPQGFDFYVIGLLNCASLSIISEKCSQVLQGFNQGKFEEFSHTMTNNGQVRSTMALMVFVKQDLVDQGLVSMSRVDCVRDRRLSTLRVLAGASRGLSMVRQLSSDETNGGALTMNFRFGETNFLLINVKQSCIGELNEILARAEPEKQDHVFMFGDFGEDVLEGADELDQRLFLEGFNTIPGQFQNSRYLTVTRSKNPRTGKCLKPAMHGLYDLVPKKAPAAFSTFRLFGGVYISKKEKKLSNVPPPPRDDEALRQSMVPPPPDLRPSMIPPPPAGAPLVDTSSQGKTNALRKAIRSLSRSSSISLPPPPSSSSSSASAGAPAAADAPLVPLGTCKVCALEISNEKDLFQAMDDKYHVECCKCSDCGKLITSQFFMVDDKLLCSDSYERLMIQTCSGCNERVDPVNTLIQTDSGLSYHVDCFKCAECNCFLASFSQASSSIEAFGKFFIDESNGNMLLCEQHAPKSQTHECAVCASPAKDPVQVVLGEGDNAQKTVMCNSCFCCKVCKKTIESLGGQYLTHQGDFYCQEDYNKELGLFCTICTDPLHAGQPFLSAFEGKKFHKDCFACSSCKSPAVHRLATEGDKNVLICGSCTS